jgi:hypothetical protein
MCIATVKDCRASVSTGNGQQYPHPYELRRGACTDD